MNCMYSDMYAHVKTCNVETSHHQEIKNKVKIQQMYRPELHLSQRKEEKIQVNKSDMKWESSQYSTEKLRML